ncbi:Serine/threonine protein kinase [Magnetospirillum sp. LM-5]|uniref:serine/threonine-protein kinase n=1 Tax=Magnetospirillum sp. LM-5 TaxID=2681466 RepID=UPI00138433B5|nr:serine/threonine-protein kinase [Magnetospirillum sp. LM-5]CAA7617950.1 Serine/threonine protein kinase [Magnetospirillum sp. LM-5]
MERIGKYVVHKAAISTGYAKVFFCHDPDLQIPVAVKLFNPRAAEDGAMSAPQLLARFQVEARSLAAFDHPHIVAVKAMEVLADGRPFFVMPYMPAGLTFEIGKDSMVEGAAEQDVPRRLALVRALAVLRQASAGLMAIHRRGMVHRSIQPSNLLLTARENGQVRIADFSTIKLPERNAPMPDHWIGGTEYCAPEQREAATAVGPQADVFSLGVLTYRLLTGALPVLADGSVELPAKHPEVLVDLVAQATDPDPAKRPAHAGVFLQELAKVPTEAVTKPKVSVVPLRKSMVIPKKAPTAS